MSTTTQGDLEALAKAIENNNVSAVKEILLDFDVTVTLDSLAGGHWMGHELETNCLMLACKHHSTPEVMKLIFEKIIEAGDTELLKSQLTATPHYGTSALGCAIIHASSHSSKLIAVALFYFGLFKAQYENLRNDDRIKVRGMIGIDSSSWTPDTASLCQIEILLEGVRLVNAIRNKQHSRMRELLKNNENAKKMLSSKFGTIMRLCSEPKTPIETMKLLLSEIKRIGGGNIPKQVFNQENDDGETWLISVCSRGADSERLEFLLNMIEEVGGEEFLAEQISKKRQSDVMSCCCALCRLAPTSYEILSLLVSKILQLEHGRHILRGHPRLEIFVGTADERKFLFLVVGLCSITGTFKDQYSRLDKEKRKILQSICNIKSGDWSRAPSNDSTTGDVIGEIKKSIVENDK